MAITPRTVRASPDKFDLVCSRQPVDWAKPMQRPELCSIVEIEPNLLSSDIWPRRTLIFEEKLPLKFVEINTMEDTLLAKRKACPRADKKEAAAIGRRLPVPTARPRVLTEK